MKKNLMIALALLVPFLSPHARASVNVAVAPLSALPSHDYGFSARVGLDAQDAKKTYLFNYLNLGVSFFLPTNAVTVPNTSNIKSYASLSSALYVNTVEEFYVGARAGLLRQLQTGLSPGTLTYTAVSVQKRFSGGLPLFAEIDVALTNGVSEMLVGLTF